MVSPSNCLQSTPSAPAEIRKQTAKSTAKELIIIFLFIILFPPYIYQLLY
jgi:hypothetical protein